MIISKEKYDGLFVWAWLPNEVEPIVIGQLKVTDDLVRSQIHFGYGQKFLANDKRFSLYQKELPLVRGLQSPNEGLDFASCIRDSAPDQWGRRVIINKIFNPNNVNFQNEEADELTYLAMSGSDRIGCLDFQTSSTHYEPRLSGNVELDQLMEAAQLVEKGVPLTDELAMALQHGTAVGGARPKALIDSEDAKWLAKFSSSTDTFNIVKSEYIAMRLADICGLSVAHVEHKNVLSKDVLLVKRFDREKTPAGWVRHHMLSAFTLSGLSEGQAMYTSYSDLANTLRQFSLYPERDVRELFGRMVFNIIIGNTDDHTRNHAVFYDGQGMELTKAYDICAMQRIGGEATQALALTDGVKDSKLENCFMISKLFLLNQNEAKMIINTMLETVSSRYKEVCGEVEFSHVDRERLWGSAIMNPSIFYPVLSNKPIFKVP